jgi:hypothetical protein
MTSSYDFNTPVAMRRLHAMKKLVQDRTVILRINEQQHKCTSLSAGFLWLALVHNKRRLHPAAPPLKEETVSCLLRGV